MKLETCAGWNEMKLVVNGEERTVRSESWVPLLWVLRDELGMTGAKFGCGVGFCGDCTVQVDGRATQACITPLAAVQGKEVRTIAGPVYAAVPGAPNESNSRRQVESSS